MAKDGIVIALLMITLVAAAGTGFGVEQKALQGDLIAEIIHANTACNNG